MSDYFYCLSFSFHYFAVVPVEFRGDWVSLHYALANEDNT